MKNKPTGLNFYHAGYCDDYNSYDDHAEGIITHMSVEELKERMIEYFNKNHNNTYEDFINSLEEEGLIISSYGSRLYAIDSDFDIIFCLDDIKKEDLFTEETLLEIAQRKKEEEEKADEERRLANLARQKLSLKESIEKNLDNYRKEFPEKAKELGIL